MAKKVKIDLFDISVDDSKRAFDREESPAPGDHKRQARGPDRSAWIRRLGPPRSKILLSLVFLFVAAAVGAGWLYYGGHKVPSMAQKSDGLKEMPQAAEKVTLFDQFVVDVQGKKGDIRIAFLDVAVEWERPGALSQVSDPLAIRTGIYWILKKNMVADGLLSPESRARIKIELQHEIDRLAGERAVKNVYITRCEVM